MTGKFKSAEPYFEEIGQVEPLPLEEHLKQKISAEVKRVVHALGLKNCAIHAELKLVDDRPYIIEIGARLAGDKIPFLVEQALGISMAELSARVALGEKISSSECQPQNIQHAAIGFFVPKESGTIKRLPKNECLSTLKKKALEFELWAKLGEQIELPPAKFFTRLGYVVVCVPSSQEAIAKVDLVITEVEKEIGIELFKISKV